MAKLFLLLVVSIFAVRVAAQEYDGELRGHQGAESCERAFPPLQAK